MLSSSSLLKRLGAGWVVVCAGQGKATSAMSVDRCKEVDKGGQTGVKGCRRQGGTGLGCFVCTVVKLDFSGVNMWSFCVLGAEGVCVWF